MLRMTHIVLKLFWEKEAYFCSKTQHQVLHDLTTLSIKYRIGEEVKISFDKILMRVRIFKLNRQFVVVTTMYEQ